jgi:NitT/TauT family transport system ATP-binding protein
VFSAVGDRPENPVLKNLEFQVEPGSFVVITGPSGGGKSTLLNIVAGLDTDFDGAVDFDSDNLAFVFQSPRLLPWRTVYENIALALPKDDPRLANIPEMLKRVGLAEAANAYPEMISLGMQRRAALARAFVLDPDLLLMDEPFVSLDEPTAHALRELLVELWSRKPTTVLFVTHDRPEAVMLATRILRLSSAPATIAQDVPVRLSVADRSDREKVRAEQRRIFGEA